MTGLSCAQKKIVELPLGAVCVTACAGSGKTRTAVRRLWEVRKKLEDRHGIVALLSFSNVAVDTFRKDYHALSEVSGGPYASAVEISTIDAFITANILRPHAHRTMGASRTAYLVHGREPFLGNYKVFDGKQNRSIAELTARVVGDSFVYSVTFGHGSRPIDQAIAEKAIAKFGKTGAFTHSLGRYWAIQTLADQPFVLRALARRYPHIIVDEAQDIGSEHEIVLEALRGAGVQLSLIGDVNQGIYEFAGADGKYLGGFGSSAGVFSGELIENYRSVPDIVTAANNLTGRSDTATRKKPDQLSGAFIVPYKKDAQEALLATFRSLLDQANVTADRAAIVCRGTDTVDEWRGAAEMQGQGTMRSFAEACIARDGYCNLPEAFEQVCHGIVALLVPDHSNLLSLMSLNGASSDVRRAKHLIWAFMRDPASGLPSGMLPAAKEWHPALLKNVRNLLQKLESECGLKSIETVGNKLAKTKLTDSPLLQAAVTHASAPTKYRVSTVHRVKGESIDAVMYVATKANVRDMLNGTGSDDGRIGYVALTRARDLFVLAVPESALSGFEAKLYAKGFKKAPS
jgi:superfamily I DNA/RNA helicase